MKKLTLLLASVIMILSACNNKKDLKNPTTSSMAHLIASDSVKKEDQKVVKNKPQTVNTADTPMKPKQSSGCSGKYQNSYKNGYDAGDLQRTVGSYNPCINFIIDYAESMGNSQGVAWVHMIGIWDTDAEKKQAKNCFCKGWEDGINGKSKKY